MRLPHHRDALAALRRPTAREPRDHRTLAALRALVDPGFAPAPGLLDHHEHPWVLEHLPL